MSKTLKDEGAVQIRVGWPAIISPIKGYISYAMAVGEVEAHLWT